MFVSTRNGASAGAAATVASRSSCRMRPSLTAPSCSTMILFRLGSVVNR